MFQSLSKVTDLADEGKQVVEAILKRLWRDLRPASVENRQPYLNALNVLE